MLPEVMVTENDLQVRRKHSGKRQRVLFLNSHPIQYFAPLYKCIQAEKSMDLMVLYCSRHGLKGELDREFGVDVKWDVPVLEGYPAIFLKNHSFRPGIYGFAGLLNLGIIPFLFKSPKSTLVVHGWGYLTNLLAIIFGRLAGHTVCIRGESPASHEQSRSGPSLLLRKWLYGKLLFRFAHYFCYIGKENRRFYRLYGVPENKLIFAPYAVDNQRFQNAFRELFPAKMSLRKALGLPSDKKIVLFSGKYIDKKRPLDLLQAFRMCHLKRTAFLIFMGEGELREKMEQYIRDHKMDNVRLTGFVNQSEVARYYAIADLFVMCSKEGETWGLSSNEAMNFHLPVLLSDMTGSSADLVRAGENGYVFQTGNPEDLSNKLDKMLAKSGDELAAMGRRSAEIIHRYSYETIIDAIAGLKPDAEASVQNLNN